MHLIKVILLLLPCFAHADLIDPTRPLGQGRQIKEEQALNLQAVYSSTSGVKAVVNGRAVSVGDSVLDWEVERIYAKSVRLFRQGSSKTLYLRSTVLKK